MMPAKENKMENEMMESAVAPAEESIPAPVAPSAAAFDDLKEIDAFDTWRDRETSAERTDTQDILFTNLPINVQRFETTGRDGTKYNSYGVAFATKVRGEELVQKMFVVPPHSDRMIYDTLAMIFGEANVHPLEIVKTVSTRNDKQVATYSMRVSVKDDFGSDIICTLSPSGRGDRVIFQNLLEIFKKRGLIS